MTVSELIKKLQEMPPDLSVWYSTAYDSDEVKEVTEEKGNVLFAGKDKEFVHLTY